LSNLWSILGGNKKQKAVFANNLATLSQFEKGRQGSRDVVIKTTAAYQTMMAQVEELREQVARPGLLEEYAIPIEVHIKSIQMGIERMRTMKRTNLLSSDDDDSDSLGWI